ncbi:MAG: DNA polymerase III subunit alpha, partial [Deltaproteobacteria bacterium]|nr:DNA polymerase III subunit alpha [Deltaproteobacteria bacterium]
ITVLPPDINKSEKEFTVSGTRIQFGLLAIKNVGEGAIDSIIEARQNGPFNSIFDFCERVDLRKVNKRVIESLIKCGAFDGTGADRAAMVAALEDALEYGQVVQKERSDPQIGLFTFQGKRQGATNAPALPAIAQWEEKQRLAYEKEALGFYISGHPLKRYEELIEKFTNADTLSLPEMKDGQTVRIGGVVLSVKTIITKKGEPMAFAVVEDLQGAVECTVFPAVYAKASELLVEDTPILIQGQVQKDENAVKILTDTVIPMEKAEEIWTAAVHLTLDVRRTEKSVLSKIHDILKRHPGSCPAYVHLQDPDRTETIIALPDRLKLKAGASLTREINGFLGYKAIETVCTDTVY